ncbi:MAG: hypothetical protein MI806_33775 [Minwuiales bacterium]|nr:hypothetical protein [Minwuiales bacterium]
MTKWVQPDVVPKLLRPGMTVFVAGAGNEPLSLIDALKAEPTASAGVRYVALMVPGINDTDYTALHAETRLTVFFATPTLRDGLDTGRIDFVPMQYRAIHDYLSDGIEIDLALIQVAPPDADGHCSQGLNVDFVPAVLNNAKAVVAEVNKAMPATKGAPAVPLDRIDYAVEAEHPLPTFPVGKVTDEARAIGDHVAALVHDGDCIQTGIGAIPNAVLAALGTKNDLGFQSGMIADGVIDLAEAGVLTGKAKTVDPGKIVTGITLGTQKLYDWAGARPDLLFRPVDYTHDVGVLRRIDNFVSINSALEIDLFGQVNADMLAGRQISGTGGSVDLMRGAALSRGGRSIVALNATAAGGKLSRIVPALAPENAATALRTDIDYVVTEYGAVRLRHLPVEARAETLIGIAAPDFRDTLHEQWKLLRKRAGG